MEIQIKYPLSNGFYFKASGEVLIHGFEGHPFKTEAYVHKVVFGDRLLVGLIVPVEKMNHEVLAKIKIKMIHEAEKTCRTQSNSNLPMEPMPLRRNGSESIANRCGGTTKPAKMLQS